MCADPRVDQAIRGELDRDPRASAAAVARRVAEALGLPVSRERSIRRRVANLAKQASEAGATLEMMEVGMVRGTKQAAPGDVLERLRGCDVEARMLSGACIRGTLRAATPEWLSIERSSNCRMALVRVAAVATLVDESAPRLHEVGRRDAEAAFDREEA